MDKNVTNEYTKLPRKVSRKYQPPETKQIILRKTQSIGEIKIPLINKHPETEPRTFVLMILALNLVNKWIPIKNFAMTKKTVSYTT